MSRLPPQPRAALSPDQRALHDHFHTTIRSVVATSTSTSTVRPNVPGATPTPPNAPLPGIFPFLATIPSIGRLSLDMLSGLKIEGALPPTAREIVALVTTTHFRCAYATYAHREIARSQNLLDERQMEMIEAGQEPEGLDEEGKLAYETTRFLLEVRGLLSEEIWGRCVEVWGKEGAVGLVHYVALFSWTSLGLNAADVSGGVD